jgi:hypothetical protein
VEGPDTVTNELIGPEYRANDIRAYDEERDQEQQGEEDLDSERHHRGRTGECVSDMDDVIDRVRVGERGCSMWDA